LLTGGGGRLGGSGSGAEVTGSAGADNGGLGRGAAPRPIGVDVGGRGRAAVCVPLGVAVGGRGGIGGGRTEPGRGGDGGTGGGARKRPPSVGASGARGGPTRGGGGGGIDAGLIGTIGTAGSTSSGSTSIVFSRGGLGRDSDPIASLGLCPCPKRKPMASAAFVGRPRDGTKRRAHPARAGWFVSDQAAVSSAMSPRLFFSFCLARASS
jgi:hypothetical protein